MNDIQEILKRYYKGETTLAEEKFLKQEYRLGHLPEDPFLSVHPVRETLPAGLYTGIKQKIQNRKRRYLRQIYWTTGSIAATLILILFIKGSFQQPLHSDLQLSDNMKRERFEDALRTIGHALEEKNEQVLYENNHLIITIEK